MVTAWLTPLASLSARTCSGINTASLLVRQRRATSSALTGKLASPSLISGVSGQPTQPMLVLVPVQASFAVGPEQFAGRVITFTLPDFTWSTRVLRAQGTEGQATTGFVISLAPVAGCRGVTFNDLDAAIRGAAAATSPDFIVNTREFVGDPNATLPPGVAKDTNEPYDGFDAANPILAQIVASPPYSPTSPTSAIGTALCVARRTKRPPLRPAISLQSTTTATGCSTAFGWTLGFR